MKHVAALAIVSVLATTTDPRPITFDDLTAIGTVSDPQVSADGAAVLFTVGTTATWRVATSGGTAHRFPDDTTQATEARWSPDGRRVAYIASGQLWLATGDGHHRQRITSLWGGATGPKWSPDGTRLAFTSRVYPSCADDTCNRTMRSATVHVADHLLYRHWNAWDDGTRAHLFVISAGGGPATDLTRGALYDVPPGPFGGSEGYNFSPDGKELAFTAKNTGDSTAWSTNVDVWTVPVAGGRPVDITADNAGADQNPVYSPDGCFIAYQSQARAGYESDRWRLMVYDRRSRDVAEILPSWDRDADSYVFASDSSIILGSLDRGRETVYRVHLPLGSPVPLVTGWNDAAFTLSADAKTIVWLRDAGNHPPEVYAGVLGPDGITAVHQVSHITDAVVSHLQIQPLEEFWYAGADGDSVQGFLLKPPQWKPNTTFPAVVLIHGGPHAAWLDSWRARWNYQMFAAPGFGVILVNPRGSAGYGQRFNDGVAKDWGGKVYTDIMDGVDAALARAPWIDRTRLAAAGPSYGGYMVNWIAGHSDRFKALVTHAGMYNLESMSGTTDELWFTDWELDTAAFYSPHLYAKHFKTPTLVLHGEQDFRVPYTQGLAMFTALQRQGVPSRLVVFPDEGHWIGKPENQRIWWSEVQSWLRRYLQ
jgi:dipeptidyl aminopeptidase/acylaminoacyl peptidase